MSDAVVLQIDGPVAWVTLNRPDSLNAINAAVRAELPARIREAENDASVRVIVLRGAGDRAFCAGADIHEFVEVASPAKDRQRRVHASWIRAFDEARKPIVASIHGYCLGGGLEIALACDIRIVSENAVLGLPETGLGVITGVGGSQRIQRVLGLGLALDMILTGERISGERAYQIGLASRIAPTEQLSQATVQLADQIVTKGALATELAKEAVKQGQDMELSAGLRLEADLLTLLLNSEDRLSRAREFATRK